MLLLLAKGDKTQIDAIVKGFKPFLCSSVHWRQLGERLIEIT